MSERACVKKVTRLTTLYARHAVPRRGLLGYSGHRGAFERYWQLLRGKLKSESKHGTVTNCRIPIGQKEKKEEIGITSI